MADTKATEADTPSTNVALQATFEIPKIDKSITINTADILKKMPNKGEIKFNLDEPQDIGSIKEGLEGVYTLFDLGKPPDVSTWPSPFDDLAQADLTVTLMCVDQKAKTWAFGMDITFDPTATPTIPIVDIKISKIGFKINKGQCPAEETDDTPKAIEDHPTQKKV